MDLSRRIRVGWKRVTTYLMVEMELAMVRTLMPIWIWMRMEIWKATLMEMEMRKVKANAMVGKTNSKAKVKKKTTAIGGKTPKSKNKVSTAWTMTLPTRTNRTWTNQTPTNPTPITTTTPARPTRLPKPARPTTPNKPPTAPKAPSKRPASPTAFVASWHRSESPRRISSPLKSSVRSLETISFPVGLEGMPWVVTWIWPLWMKWEKPETSLTTMRRMW
mmetsp:Transcript_122185/g.182529  ORF Transcript_122185/g.182529 Transcript_122185/m.182529 type:complete len:219 (+) Transcript_122185:45-701(+)